MDGETDVFTGHIVVKDEALEKPEEMKMLIKSELDKHHIEHTTIELESESSCSGIDCETDKDHSHSHSDSH
jgi:cobalt-zinc-cadmium efflux system protein